MQLNMSYLEVPTQTNSTFGHIGGIGEVNAGAFKPGGFANK